MTAATLCAAPGSPRQRLQRMSLWMRALIAAGAFALVGVVLWMSVSETALLDASRRLSGPAAVTAEELARSASTRVWIVATTLPGVLLSWHNPPGQRRLVLGFGWEDYLCLLFGGLLFAVSWAMVEATRIETENAGFV